MSKGFRWGAGDLGRGLCGEGGRGSGRCGVGMRERGLSGGRAEGKGSVGLRRVWGGGSMGSMGVGWCGEGAL